MSRRLKLHKMLVDVVLGSRNVYFQPPSTVKMSYPCIVYSRNNFELNFANDKIYRAQKAYSVTVIDPNPDSTIPDKMLGLPYCRFDRHFTADNLNHDIFILYY